MKSTTKILVVGLCLLGTALTASAQLEVTENGKVYIQRPATDSIACLSVGDSPHFIYEDHVGLDMGIFVHKYGDYGLFSEAISNGGSSVAVYGEALGNGRKFGVFGSVPPLTTGAGICGTDEYGYIPSFSGLYGGFIYDDLYVDGRIITTLGFYNASDMRLIENVDLMSQNEEGTTALEKLQCVDVLEYNLRRPSQDSMDGEGAKRELTAREKAHLKKRHFGVSAQDLQKLYPELVEENQEGYLMVNYVELVPVLIRSIQELKTELDNLKGKKGDDLAAARTLRDAEDAGTVATSASSRVSPLNAVLYQNTPNPFTAQTEIRFSLPDDAPASYIYIFDMTGKMQRQIPVSPSQQSVTINGYELSAGIYLYSLVVGGQEIDTKRMILSK